VAVSRSLAAARAHLDLLVMTVRLTNAQLLFIASPRRTLKWGPQRLGANRGPIRPSGRPIYFPCNFAGFFLDDDFSPVPT
jgi:hypothetical protein